MHRNLPHQPSLLQISCACCRSFRCSRQQVQRSGTGIRHWCGCHIIQLGHDCCISPQRQHHTHIVYKQWQSIPQLSDTHHVSPAAAQAKLYSDSIVGFLLYSSMPACSLPGCPLSCNEHKLKFFRCPPSVASKHMHTLSLHIAICIVRRPNM